MEVAAILKRRDAMLTARQACEQQWTQCYLYTYPERADGFFGNRLDANSIAARRADIMDSTGTDSARILASAIQSGLTPANSRWFELDVQDATHEEKVWLEGSAEVLWENIHNSNFDAVGFEGCLDIVCAGQAAIFIDEDKEHGGFAFEQWPLAQLALGSTRTDGRIDIVHRTYHLTAEQAVKEFENDGGVSEATAKLAAEKPDELVEFIHAIFPRKVSVVNPVRAKHLPVASHHIEVKAKRCVRESGYHEMPVVLPRWLRLPNSVYATGPVKDALPDIKTLNEIVRLELANADLAISGMWIAEDDGVLNPRTIKVGPRKVIVANSVDSMKPLHSGADFNVAFTVKRELQAAIRKTLMADQLQPIDGPEMTKFEVQVRVDLIRQQLGPMYGRLQSEWLKPLVERCFGIAFRAGIFTDPPATLAGRDFTVRYSSPMARAQRLEDVTAMDRFEQAIGVHLQAGMDDAGDGYDWDKSRMRRGELLGVPKDLLLDDKAIAKKREARAEKAAADQQTAIANGAMATAADASAKKAVAA
jgi:hypothetical protein